MNDNSIDYADNSLDILKTICAILIVGSHLLPLVPNTTFNELYGQWFFRFSVPVFFVASGYFFSGMQKKKRVKYIFRILVLYVVSMLLYSPFIIKEYIGGDIGKIQLLKYVLFGYGHLWYLIALCVSLVIWQIVSCFDCKKIFSDKFVIIIALMLLGIGAFFDEYYHLFDNSFIKRIGWRIDSICSTRSALFMGLPLVLIGRCIYYKQAFFMNKRKFLYLFLCVTFSLSLVETLFLTQ